MSDLQQDVDRAVRQFLVQITEIVGRAARQTLDSAFAEPVTSRIAAFSIAASTIAASTIAAQIGERHGLAVRHGARRGAQDLDAVSQRITAVVQANPGVRIGQIGEQLDMTTKQLTWPIRRLVADGVIHATGRRRMAGYFALAPGAAVQSRPLDGEVPGAAPVAGPAGEPGNRAAAAMPRAGSAGEIDADWQRCLADVFTLAQRLQK